VHKTIKLGRFKIHKVLWVEEENTLTKNVLQILRHANDHTDPILILVDIGNTVLRVLRPHRLGDLHDFHIRYAFQLDP